MKDDLAWEGIVYQKRGVKSLMVDSGAFTVWSVGGVIDLDAYIAFCKRYLDVIDAVVALDVIPGRPRNKLSLTKEAIEKACRKGWDNYQRMLDAGLPKEKVIPVFHQNDGWKWLERFMAEEVPYFGLSPANDRDTYRRQMWLDTCMNYVCDKNGMPLAKFHGFAVTSVPLMMRYPWYSVDSASWLRFAIYGSIMMPRRKPDGEWDFCHAPLRVFFSTKMGEASSEKGTHYKHLSSPLRRSLDEYLKEAGVVFGRSSYRKEHRKYKHNPKKENLYERAEDHVIVETREVPGISNNVEMRGLANYYFFSQVAKHLSWPRPFKPGEGRKRLLPI